MTASIVQISFTLDHKNLVLKPGKNNNFFSAASEWTHRGGGVYNLFSLFQKCFEGVVWCSRSLSISASRVVAFSSAAAEVFKQGKSPMIITKITSFTGKKFWHSVVNFYNSRTLKLCEKLCYDVLDLGLDFVTFGGIFRLAKKTSQVLVRVSTCGYLGLHMWDIKRGYENYSEDRSLAGQSVREIQVINKDNKGGFTTSHPNVGLERIEAGERFDTYMKERNRLNMLKIISSILNVAKDFFSVLNIFMTVAVLSSFSLWALGALSVLGRVVKEFYDVGMTYERITE